LSNGFLRTAAPTSLLPLSAVMDFDPRDRDEDVREISSDTPPS
jgi:hypothetical protein